MLPASNCAITNRAIAPAVIGTTPHRCPATMSISIVRSMRRPSVSAPGRATRAKPTTSAPCAAAYAATPKRVRTRSPNQYTAAWTRRIAKLSATANVSSRRADTGIESAETACSTATAATQPAKVNCG